MMTHVLWKWTGGKRQLLPELRSRIDDLMADGGITRYAEPFIGGGALFWNLIEDYEFDAVYIGDMNAEMLNVYRLVKDDPEALCAELSKHAANYLPADADKRKELYYQCRARYNELIKAHPDGIYPASEMAESAGLFLMLGRTCFNGLYRTNKSGFHNVPHGKYKNPKIDNSEEIREDSKALASLKSLEIHLGSYKDSLSFVDEHTLVYLDPPYRPLPNFTQSFTAYDKSGFNDDDQKELAAYCRKIDKMGGKFMLSNSDPHNTDPDDDFFDELYKGFVIERVKAKRNINSDGKGRGAIDEILVRNWE